MVDLCVQHLTGASTSRPRKKQRKQQPAGTGEAAGEEEAWVLRGRVLRALHRCFLYDTVGFVDQDKVCVCVCTCKDLRM